MIGKNVSRFSNGWKIALALCVAAPAFGQMPVVTNTIPLNGSNNVARSTHPIVQFSTSVMGETVTSNRFFAYSALHGYQRGAITLNAATNQAALDPSTEFDAGERTFAYLTRGVTNAAGTTSAVPCAWSFYVEAANGNARLAENGQVFTANVTSVSLGDVNGDGHVDAVFGVQSGTTNSLCVMFNNGQGVFTVGQSNGTENIVGSAMADVDRDGDLDLFLAHFGMPATLWLNNGAGVFTNSGQPLPIASTIVPGDFDGDGFCDVAIADFVYQTPVRVCLNDGLGMFTNGVQSYSIYSYALDIGDMDSDGDLDIVSGNSSEDTVLVNDGTGHFSVGWSGGWAYHDTFGIALVKHSFRAEQPRWAYHDTFGIALGDVDGDGDLDAVESGYYGPTTYYGLRILTNDGTGQLSLSQVTGPVAYCHGIALGDLDADGDLDAVLGGTSGHGNTTVWTNDGHGLFGPSGQAFGSYGNEYGTRIGLADLDEDGALDIAVSYQESHSHPFWINNAPEMEVLGTNGAPIGDPTLLVLEPPDAAKGTRMGVFPTGNASFTNRLTITNSGPGILRLKQPVVDRPDASWFRVGSLPAALPPGATTNLDIIFAPGFTGWDTLTARVSFANDCWHPALDGAETNMQIWISAMGVPPLMISNVYPDSPAADIAHGAVVSGRFGEEPSTVADDALCVYGSQGGVWHGVVSYDAGGRVVSLYPPSDYRPGEYVTAVVPLVVSNAAGTTRFRPFAWSFHARAADGTGYFTQAPDPAITNMLLEMNTAVGDLNGDGILDALVGVMETGVTRKLTIALNDGTGRLVERDALRPPAGSSSLMAPTTLSDLDGDGDIDVVTLISASGANGLAVWKNDGAGHFTNTFVYLRPASDGPSQVRTADADGDGDIDVLFAMFSNSGGDEPPVWLNDGTGQFSPVTNNSSGCMAFPSSYGCDVGDVNGDGALDLVFSSSPDGMEPYIRIWLNDGRGRFSDSGQRLDTNMSYSVHMGDLNGNGHLDIFAVRAADARIWTNDGSGRFSFASEITLPVGPGQYNGQGLADLDADGDLDVIVGGWEWAANRVLLNDGAGHFTISDADIGNGGYMYSTMGDLNGDGAVDLLLSRVNVSPKLQVWLNGTRPKAGFGKALRFDGTDDCLRMPGAPANQFSGSNDFTIAMWVRPETNGHLYRMEGSVSPAQFRDYVMLDSSGRVSFALANGVVSSGSRADSAHALPWNRWSHVAAVKEGAAVRVYVNGALDGTGVVATAVTSAPQTTGDSFFAAYGPSSGFFRGDLDEIQIWRTALSAAEIADWQYRTPDRIHPSLSNLVAHLACDEGVARRTTSREGPPLQGDFSAGMDSSAWIDSDVRDWRTWVNHPLDGRMIGSWADGTSSDGADWNLDFEIVGQGSLGTVKVTAANGFEFTPSTNGLGTNVFTYHVITTNGLTSSVAAAYVIVPPDYDEDAMPDLWEEAHGLNPSDWTDAFRDSDEDGCANGEEWLADTDPTNDASFFCITNVTPASPYTVYFHSSTGRVYTMGGATDLVDGAWTNVLGAGPRLGAGGVDSMTDTNEPPAGPFYRLEVQMP